MLLEHERYHVFVILYSYGLGMDALVTVCSLNTDVSMDLYGLGMDALVTVCSWNTNVSMD